MSKTLIVSIRVQYPRLCGVFKRLHATRLRSHKQRQTHKWSDRFKELVSHSPRLVGYLFERWTAQWLSKHLAKELGTKVLKFWNRR
ncbi:hypothetical protein [Nostoc sp. LPT]|uniref:hypothetical protein n=1 Tax=Nostoc sp. LPT TaxID=2815387 RepID=UPI001D2241A2|nr:hypothetical protein [Nostoc sp. LPT]